MIQDIYPHKLYNQFDACVKPSPDDHVLMFEGDRAFINVNDGHIYIPFVKDIYPDIKDHTKAEPLEISGNTTAEPIEISENTTAEPAKSSKNMDALSRLIYAFSVDNERYFLLVDHDDIKSGRFEFTGINKLRDLLLGMDFKEPEKLFALYTAKHLNDWYLSNRYCGKCSHIMEHSRTERAMVCPNCNNTVYPKIMPAVIVGVKNGDKLLITRYRTGYAHNALIAGFTEIGETLEETVEREVMEEAGIKVKNIKYYRSQPWGIVSDILAGFYCEVDGDDTIKMDEGELKYASWVKRDEIVLQPGSYSLTNEMMKRFKEGLE